MKKLIIVVAAAVFGSLGLLAAPAQGAVTVCHDVNINLNGQVVADAGCNTLPPEG